jgi:hypothetical protein
MLAALLPLLSAVPSIIDCFTGDEAKDKGLGEKVLDVVETVTGTRDPESAAELLSKRPDLLTELEIRIQEFNLEYFREETKRLESVNRTMRVESKSDDPWTRRWRPFWGFASGCAFVFVCILVCFLGYEAVTGANENALRMIPDLVTAFATLFAIPGAILGVASWHRGKMQRIEAGESQTKMETLYQKFFGGKK